PYIIILFSFCTSFSSEVASHGQQGLETDVWSVGCMLYTLLVGRPPFDTREVRSTLTRVLAGDYQLPSSLSPEAADLISNLLRRQPNERMKLRAILAHSFMTTRKSTPARRYMETSNDSGIDSLSRTPLSCFINNQNSNTRLTNTASLGHNSSGSTMSSHLTVQPSRNRVEPAEPPLGVYPSQTQLLPSSANSGYAPSIGAGHAGHHQTYSRQQQQHYPLQASYRRWLNGTSLASAASNAPLKATSEAITGSYQPPSATGDGANEAGSFNACAISFDAASVADSLLTPISNSISNNAPGYLASSGKGHVVRSSSLSRVGTSAPSVEVRSKLTSSATQQPLQVLQHFVHTTHSPFPINSRPSPAMPTDISGQTTCLSGFSFSSNPSMPTQSTVNIHGTDTTTLTSTLPPAALTVSSMSNLLSIPANSTSTDYKTPIVGSTSNVSYQKPRLPLQHQPRLTPLNSCRLRPMRTRTRLAMINILPDESVCLEFFASHGSGTSSKAVDASQSSPSVVEVMGIDKFGRRIVIYKPNGDHGVPCAPASSPSPEVPRGFSVSSAVDGAPPPACPGQPCAIFGLDELPSRYWKKYSFASRFVGMVRAHTPKVTLYTNHAKCLLMENGGMNEDPVGEPEGEEISSARPGDFEAEFYGPEGPVDVSTTTTRVHLSMKLTQSAGTREFDQVVRITTPDDAGQPSTTSLVLSSNRSLSALAPDTRRLLEITFQSLMQVEIIVA
ncbi:unnamed protein product, partial [Protopolystoma xenopodis]